MCVIHIFFTYNSLTSTFLLDPLPPPLLPQSLIRDFYLRVLFVLHPAYVYTNPIIYHWVLSFQAGFEDVHVVDEVNLLTKHQTTLYMQVVS